MSPSARRPSSSSGPGRPCSCGARAAAAISTGRRRPVPSDAPVVLYTDGACSGNPGPGGWAAIIVEGDAERVVSGAEPHTTNQRMELRAALEGLAAVPGRRRVEVHTDSAYVMNCFRDRWYEKWEANGWVGAGKKPVTNRDLWERLIAQTRRHDVHWVKVKGHSGHVMNDRVDALARGAIATLGPASRS